MSDINDIAFRQLFRQACEKCFAHPLTAPLSETDSKLFSNRILEQTGLVIGVKSIKNYSIYIANEEGKKENPSVATLDTLARFVLNAPYTDEIQRKKEEGHYPWWFEYRAGIAAHASGNRKISTPKKGIAFMLIAAIIISASAIFILHRSPFKHDENFVERFNNVSIDSLTKHSWSIQNIDTVWWNKRSLLPGHLSLFTLRADNWPNEHERGKIKNLMTRPLSSDCFSIEIHLSDFTPIQNWQQAGILLAEDTTFTGKVIRLSVSYNDFFGGYKLTPEIILQGVSSTESENHSKPEEFLHAILFKVEPGQENLVKQNLRKLALKIEKRGNHFRFLYTAGSMESFAFREAVAKDFIINTKYIGLFAIKGFSEGHEYIPANFDSFSITNLACDK